MPDRRQDRKRVATGSKPRGLCDTILAVKYLVWTNNTQVYFSDPGGQTGRDGRHATVSDVRLGLYLTRTELWPPQLLPTPWPLPQQPLLSEWPHVDPEAWPGVLGCP